MRLGLLLCTLALVVDQGTARTDFSGTWTYVEAGSTVLESGARAPTLGRDFTVKQDSGSLTIARRSSENQTPFETTFKFDGSETTGTQPGGSGQAATQVLSTAKWNAGILTTRSVMERVVNGSSIKGEVVRSLRLEIDGTMVIESENRVTPRPQVAKVTTVYRKK